MDWVLSSRFRQNFGGLCPAGLSARPLPESPRKLPQNVPRRGAGVPLGCGHLSSVWILVKGALNWPRDDLGACQGSSPPLVRPAICVCALILKLPGSVAAAPWPFGFTFQASRIWVSTDTSIVKSKLPVRSTAIVWQICSICVCYCRMLIHRNEIFAGWFSF